MTTRTKPKTKTKQYANMDSIKDTSTKHRTQPRTPSMHDRYAAHHTAMAPVVQQLATRLDALGAKVERNTLEFETWLLNIVPTAARMRAENVRLVMKLMNLRHRLSEHGYSATEITAIEDGR